MTFEKAWSGFCIDLAQRLENTASPRDTHAWPAEGLPKGWAGSLPDPIPAFPCPSLPLPQPGPAPAYPCAGPTAYMPGVPDQPQGPSPLYRVGN